MLFLNQGYTIGASVGRLMKIGAVKVDQVFI